VCEGDGPVTAYIIRRVLFLVPIVIGILAVTFLLQVFIPVDAVAMLYMGQGSKQQTEEAVALIRAKFEMDKPWYIRFVLYVGKMLRGDFGESVRTRRPVMADLGFRYINTMKLTAASLVIAVIIGVGTGIISAYYKDSILDVVAQGIGIFGISMPAFFFGVVLIMVFAVRLRWVPVLGRGDLKHLILPALNLGIIEAAPLSRITRSGMLDVLNQDYIRTARAKGLRERAVVLRHAMKNVLLPLVTMLGLQVGGLLGGAFIIEIIFGWHGVGELAVKAISWRDFAITQAVIVVSAGTYVVVNLIVDILYAFLDPRIKYRK
jgi:ABC-type dipeptide/oligopeptide/nickel transport system permease component